jgi:hydroxymethylpyrimidine/phosphomethylpyrimidine kinase
MHRVLIIAGSDSSGGAGIQADIKTVTMLGGYAMTAITALTVQNTLGVTEVMGVPPSFIGADAIKTGMLADIDTMEAVSEILLASSAFKVVDPVMVAKGGHALMREGAIDALKALMLPHADLLTPNTPEASALTGTDVVDEDGMRRAGEMILRMGAKAVLIKGGHLRGPEVVDILFTRDEEHRFVAQRIDTIHTHGTGCTLASACATLNQQGRSLKETIEMARDYLYGAIAMAPHLGEGHGPLRHNWLL